MDVLHQRRAHPHVYWQINNETAIGATEKAGLTSIQHALNRCRRLTPEQVHQRKLRVRLYLRHPILRFASAYAYFAPNDNFPVQRSRAADLLAKTPTVEQFTDAVLAGLWNEHWSGQLEQHDPVGIDEWYKFEDINATWPPQYTLGHHNRGRAQKPFIAHRLKELERFYTRDLIAWHETSP